MPGLLATGDQPHRAPRKGGRRLLQKHKLAAVPHGFRSICCTKVELRVTIF